MSVEFIDKGVSTKDLDVENGEKKEKQEENSQKKEKKEGTDFGKLEAVLSVLMENKVTSMRECDKQKRTLLGRFRTKSEGGNSAGSDPNKRNYRVNSSSTIASSCRHFCHHSYSRRSIIPCDPTEFHRYKTFSDYPLRSTEGDPSRCANSLYPQQSFDSYDASQLSGRSENCYCKSDYSRNLDKSRLSVQKCLPKRLATHHWLYSTSRQTSTETATTSSGYISPTSGMVNKRFRSTTSESDSQQVDASNDTANEMDNETVIEISKINGERLVDGEECVSGSEVPGKASECSDGNRLCEGGLKCDETCFATLPPCYSTPYLPSSCRYSVQDDPKCCSVASYRHSHPSGGHYVSCCNSPSYSVHS
ncbi:UNVERIFIED_CONTAM: hypothetical protein PYX00_008759 [Menopon gallinae]|uniref:Uncharacterized protein n=1 Tax=Menopon gallinae TaxID=328185 RepID=A0AAW2HPK4_9NEOP